MERVHAASEHPVREMQGVAVGVFSNRRHLGLLYRAELSPPPPSTTEEAGGHEEVRLLHLGWHGHEQFHNDTDTSDCAFWVSPDVEPEQAEIIAGYCRLIYSRNAAHGIPYGFGPPDGFFGEEGEMLPEGARMGLTCASFVLAVFHRAGLPLVLYDTWVPRAEDVPWQQWIIRALRRTPGVPPEHIERLEKIIHQGQVRFRPLEVAGAAASSDLPVHFEAALRLADALNAEFDRVEARRRD